MERVQVAAVLAAVVVLASMISVEVGLSVALIELGFGVVVDTLFSLDPNTDCLAFVATFASIELTFLAGTEVDPMTSASAWAPRWRWGWPPSPDHFSSPAWSPTACSPGS